MDNPTSQDGQEDGVPKAPGTGGGELTKVPNLRVCKHLLLDGGGTRRGKDE